MVVCVRVRVRDACVPIPSRSHIGCPLAVCALCYLCVLASTHVAQHTTSTRQHRTLSSCGLEKAALLLLEWVVSAFLRCGGSGLKGRGLTSGTLMRGAPLPAAGCVRVLACRPGGLSSIIFLVWFGLVWLVGGRAGREREVGTFSPAGLYSGLQAHCSGNQI